MTTYLVLLRGINVGGRNPVSMARLRECLEDLGFKNVRTYIASGNVILDSEQEPGEIQARIEDVLPRAFDLHDDVIRVLVLSREQLESIIERKPEGFGEKPDQYHSDAIFLMGIEPAEALAVFDPREGVDRIWPGDGVIYSQRLSSQRTKSRLNRIVGTPAYRSMTIRSWQTTTKLLELMRR